MEPGRMAIVGVTLAIVTVGLLVGASFLSFPTGSSEGDGSTLTRYTLDQDLFELGLEAPADWAFEMSDDTTLLLSDLRGQVVLVDLMTSWCSTCKIQNGYLETVNDNLAGILVVISLTVDESETKTHMANYVIDEGVDWPHGDDGPGPDLKFRNYFNVNSVPTMVLIDADGIFRYLHKSLWSVVSISDTVASIL